MFVIALDNVNETDLKDQSDRIDRIMAMVVNRAAERGRAWIAADMKKQVNFPTHYLSKSGRRLTMLGYATPEDPERSIIGRREPTSLARFVTGTVAKGKPVHVQVKSAQTRTIKNAFVINLRNNNKGLAMRLPNGQRPEAAYRPRRLASGLWLLYGPSVDQVFRGILQQEDQSYHQTENFLRSEFLRLLELKK